MITGSVLAKCSKIELSTADDKHYALRNNFITRLFLQLVGIPHIGFRMRARIILREALKSSSSARILDAGCGYGIYSLTLAQHGYNNIDSIDLEQKRLDAVSGMLEDLPVLRPRITLHKGSLTQLPFRDAFYDVIICSDVIEHITDDISAVKELSRVLQPNGILILSVPYNSKYHRKFFKMFGHKRPGYTKEELSALFKKYGLFIQKDYYYEYFFGNILFKVFNSFNSKFFTGILFYLFYLFYLIDYYTAFGEPNNIIVTVGKIKP